MIKNPDGMTGTLYDLGELTYIHIVWDTENYIFTPKIGKSHRVVGKSVRMPIMLSVSFHFFTIYTAFLPQVRVNRKILH